MKNIQILGIVFLVALFAFAVAAFACETLKVKLDAAQKSVDALEREIRGRSIGNHWLVRLFDRVGNQNVLDDDEDNIRDIEKWVAYRKA